MNYKRKTVSFSVFLIIFMGGFLLITAASSGIELKGQWDEAAVNEFFVNGDKAYLGCGNRFVILDISDKSTPVKLGEMPVSKSVVSVYVSGNYAYVADSGRYLGGDIDQNSRLRIVDISNPSMPQEVSSYRTQFGCEIDLSIRSVVVSGKYAYVGAGDSHNIDYYYGSLDILDISNPASPQVISHFERSNWVISEIYLSGDYVYCCTSGTALMDPPIYIGLSIIDVSTPETPQRMGYVNFSGYTRSSNRVHVSRTQAYFTKYESFWANHEPFNQGSIEIIKVSDPDSPERFWSYKTSGSAEDIYISGDFAFIADGTSGLKVVYMSKPYGFSEVAFYETPGKAQAVEFDNDYVYVAAGTGGFLILKISPNVLTHPHISLDKIRLYFGAVRGGGIITPPQAVSIANNSTGTINWTASTDFNWLKVTPLAGTGDSLIRIQVNPGNLLDGSYTGKVTITDPNASNNPQKIDVALKVYSAQSILSPWGTFETPEDNSTVMSSIPVTGWALHQIGIDNVKIYREMLPEEGSGLVYIGNAIFVEGARPDVETTYPGFPMNSKAGWGYMLLTNFLPNGGNGTFTLHAIATAVTSEQITLGTKTVICDNANADRPFGAIDTPIQGGTASGSNYVNWGWVLTPQPKNIHSDGSTIKIIVDGMWKGCPVYNIYRSDIATLFPGYANSEGAAGYFYLDTTLYLNGIHTIQWIAWDSSGRGDGIGSRYFSIQNPESTTGCKTLNAERKAKAFNIDLADLSRIPLQESAPINITTGFNQDGIPYEVYPADNGIITIKTRELQRVEINLGQPGWVGFHIIGNQLKPLPIGSHLDIETGIFSWGPGPGFVRLYELVFINKARNRLRRVNIEILPKY